MIYKILTPYDPKESTKRISSYLSEIKAKVKVATSKSIVAKLKLGFMSSVSIQVNFTETPFGSIVRITPLDLSYERDVDDVFFGNQVASSSQNNKLRKVGLIIGDLKASIDGLDESEAKHTIGLRTQARFLSTCPKCGANARQGFRCRYCDALMVEFE
jgi:hypothetical protein